MRGKRGHWKRVLAHTGKLMPEGPSSSWSCEQHTKGQLAPLRLCSFLSEAQAITHCKQISGSCLNHLHMDTNVAKVRSDLVQASLAFVPWLSYLQGVPTETESEFKTCCQSILFFPLHFQKIYCYLKTDENLWHSGNHCTCGVRDPTQDS